VAQPGLAPPARQSERDAIVVLTPRVAEVAPPSAAPMGRLVPKPRHRRSAVLVAYRRRNAAGAVRVATGMGTAPRSR
jgi:hypothetical protein